MEDKFKNYPKTDLFRITYTVPIGHPFTLTSKHVVHAKTFNGGKLTPACIVEVEASNGPSCGHPGCNKYYKEHETALVVEVGFPGELSEAPGLKDYLESCKAQMVNDGMAGFVFVQKPILSE